MKKKNKIIIGTLSTIGIGSMVIAPALAFANNQSPNNKDAISKTSTKKATTASLVTTSVTTINSHTFNDNAYLQTLDQAGITNPVGKVWTVQSSLSYFKTHLQNDINVFNCATIFRWVVIQNFNYNLNELVGTLSANSNFKVDVPNFNYTLSNIKNNGDIANFSCTLNVTIDFVITSKNDGATLSFTNNYTYNNLKYTPTITTNGYNGYGAFTLSNNANGTLTVNNATYFSRMQLSDNWTNNDFTNLLKANWLPTINPSTSITTSNYTYALADMVQRASHSISLNNNQSQFISILPTTMIDTFNLGYKFANAASIEIVMNTRGITPNANNDYTLFPGTTVTLQASQTLSSINLKNPDLAYQWEELSNGIWTNIGGATTTTYTFPVGSSTSQYRLYVYNTKNSSFYLTSNTITINPTVQTPDVTISTTSNSVTFGTSVSLDSKLSNISGTSLPTGVTYQWQYLNNNDWSNVPATSNLKATGATSATYSFTITSSHTYRLVLMRNSEVIATSNVINLTCQDTPLTLSANNSKNTSFANGTAITLTPNTNIYQATPDTHWTYTWTGPNGSITTSSTGYSEISDALKFTLSPTTAGSYTLTISDSAIGFKLTSLPITINVNNSSISLSAKANNITWNTTTSTYTATDAVPFATSVTITASGTNGLSLDSSYTYSWYFFENGKATLYATNNSDSLTINAVRNASFYVVAKNSAGDTWTSASIYVGITYPIVSISATSGASSTAATSFYYASYLSLDSSITPTLNTGDGTWTYNWIEVGNSKFNSTSQKTNYLLIANSTFEVTYNYTPSKTNSSNPYYENISFTSDPTTFTIKPMQSSSTTGTSGSHSGSTTGQSGMTNGQSNVIAPTITASETNVDLGQSSTLSLSKDSYWATYTFPTSGSYTYTYAWYNTNGNTEINHGTFSNSNESDLSYDLSSLTDTGSYYLVISCMDGNNTVFSVRSNVVQVKVSAPTITIGYMDGSSFDTTSTPVSQGDEVTLEVQPSKTTPYWYAMCKYQLVTYDVTTQSWPAPNPADWTTGNASSDITYKAGVGSYKLAVEIAGETIYSNAFTVSLNTSGRSITITQPASVAYGQDVTLSATNNGFKADGGWAFTWEVMNSSGKYVPLDQVFTNADEYTQTTSNTSASLTIKNVINNYSFELVASNSDSKIANVTSNQVSVNYTAVTLDITSSKTSYQYNDATQSPISIDATKSTWATPYDQTTKDLTYTWYENGTPIASTTSDIRTPSTTAIGTNQYYLVITDSNITGYSVKSNTIIITVSQPAITIASNQQTTSVDFGTKVTLSSALTNVATLPDNVTYQWQYLDGTTWKDVPAPTNLDDTTGTKKDYSFTITSGNTYQLELVNGKNVIATSNPLTLNCVDTPLTLSASENGKTGTSFAAGSKITITPSVGNIYQKTITSDLVYTWTSPNGQTISSSNSTYTIATDSLSFTLNATTTGSYTLTISDSAIGFKLTSLPITINVNNSSISLSATANSKTWNTTTSTYTATDEVAFDTSVALSATGNGIDLSNGYSFVWQFLDNGIWTTYTQTSARSTLTINAVKSTSFRLIATNSAGESWTSASIFVGITSTKPMITATSGASSTTATSFYYASYLNLHSSITPTLSTGDGTWHYSWMEVGNSKFNSTDQDTNYLLIANSTFEVTYTYVPNSTNKSNPYYENISFTSDPTTIMVKPMQSSSTTGTSGSHSGSTTGQTGMTNGQSNVIAPTITASETNVDLGQSSTLSLSKDSYWATYTFPTSGSYTYTYAWYSTSSSTAIASGTFDSSNEADLTQQLSSLSQTGSYYLVISCTNDKNTVFKLESNIIQITVTNPTITIGVTINNSFDSVSVGVSSTNTVTLQVVPSQTSAYWYTTCKYQWVSYNSSTNTWNTPNDGDWTSASANALIKDAVGIGSYKLAVKIANTILYSNIFTVYEQSKVNQSITLSQPTQVGYGQSATTTATCTGLTGSGWTYSWLVKNSNGTFVQIHQVLTNSDLYTASNNSLTINSVVDNYVVELQATNGSHTITSNQVSFTYTKSTLKITTATTSLVDFSTNISPIEIDTTNSTWKSPTKYASDLVYTWYQYDETNSTGWEIVQKGSSAQYTPSYQGNQSLAMGGNEFYLVITDSKIPGYKITSDTITITVSLAGGSYMSINPAINTNTTNLDKQAILSLMDEDYWTSYCLQAVNNGSMVTYSWYNTSSSYPLSVNIFNENSKFTYQLNNLNKTDEYYFVITITNHHHDVIASYKSNFVQIPVNPNN